MRLTKPGVTAMAAGHNPESPTDPGRCLSWATWRRAVAVILLTTALRVVYLVWLSPWELAGDEAYYWVQGHFLSLGYAEKGPLLAWILALCSRVFGDTEWSVRLPMAVAFGLSAWAVGRLAMAVSRGDERAGFLAVACFLLLPAFEAHAQICTQDGPLILLWTAMTAVSLRLLRRWRTGRGTWPEWLALWAMIGIGLLLKQSIVLFLPGLALYWLVFRRELPLGARFVAQQAVGVALAAAIASPMIAWNAANQWPMLEHTLGHLGAGGDQAGVVHKGNVLLWEFNAIGSFLLAFGPPAVALWIGSVRLVRARRAIDPEMWRDDAWLLCASWPTTAFFVLLSLTKPIVPTWPWPNMAPMVALMAKLLVEEWTAAAAGPNRRPRASFRFTCSALQIYGVVGTLLLAFPLLLGRLPVWGPVVREKLLSQISGSRGQADRLQAVLDAVHTADGRPPLVVERHYHPASLDLFYLRGHPAVTTSGKYGGRPSSYDRWPETSLENPGQRGRTLVLSSHNGLPWASLFYVDAVEPSNDPDYVIATNFQGVRPERMVASRAGR